MHRSRVSTIVIDCENIEACVSFWSQALGTTAGNSDGVYTSLGTTIGGLRVLLQQVPEAKTAKSRVHVDFETDDLDAEVQRLEALGARRLAQVEDWQVMEDPCGNEFCVVAVHTPDFAEHARLWER
jgi:predicted enzyme related to lactoylglutathione lyase